MAERPASFQAHEARSRSATRRDLRAPALAELRRPRLGPLGSWLRATFAFDRWLLGIVITVAVVAAGIASTAFLSTGGRDPLLLPELRDPSDVGVLVQAPTEGAPAATATPEALVVAATPTVSVAVIRADCDVIRGSAYESDAERIWFLANCIDVDANEAFVTTAGVGGPGPGVIVEPLGPDGEVVVTPAPTFATGEASWAVAAWLTGEGYQVTRGSCSTSQTGDNQWTVTCLAEPVDCAAACAGPLSVCFIPDPRTIWFC